MKSPRRFMYWHPFRVTRPWALRVMFGTDEYCNDSLLIQFPFTGAFIFFYKRGPLRTKPCAICKFYEEL